MLYESNLDICKLSSLCWLSQRWWPTARPSAAGGGGDQKLDGQLGSETGAGGANSLASLALTSSQAAASSTTSDINSMTPSNKNPNGMARYSRGTRLPVLVRP